MGVARAADPFILWHISVSFAGIQNWLASGSSKNYADVFAR
jgi:hypothetical protein